MLSKKIIKKIDEELAHIGDIRFIPHASSWGRLSCVIEVGGQKYQSWVGDPREKVTVELLLEALSVAIEVKDAKTKSLKTCQC